MTVHYLKYLDNFWHLYEEDSFYVRKLKTIDTSQTALACLAYCYINDYN